MNDVKPANSFGNKKDLTFFEFVKYKELALKTNAGICLTKENLVNFLPKNVEKVIVKNVFFESLARIF